MASGTISGGSYNARYQYYMTWTSVSNGSVANTSNVTLNWIYKKVASDSYNAYNSSGSSKVTLTINGSSSGAVRADFDLRSASVGTTQTIATYTVKDIPHNSDGTCTINVSGSHNTGLNWGTFTINSTSITLDTIPRYPTASCWVTSGSVTETTATIGWSSDSTIKQVYYSLDGGSNWTQYTSNANNSSGTIPLTELPANNTKTVMVRLYRSDSGLYKDSAAVNLTTYDYPKAQGMTNFTIGNGANINLYNPLKRTVSLYLLKTGETNTNNHIGVYNDNGSGIINAEFKTTDAINRQYNSIPNSKSGTYYCRVVYGSSIKDYNDNSNHTYSIVNNDAEKPTFASSYVTAINTANTSITGSNTNKFIKGHNALRLSINTQMTANKGSNRSYYTVSGGGLTSTTLQSSGTITNVDISGILTGNSFNVTAVDSRGLSRAVSVGVNFIDYFNPYLTSSNIKRENGIGTKAIVAFAGKLTNWSGLAQNNTITSIQYKVGSSGSWTNFPTSVNVTNDTWSISATLTNTFDMSTTYDIYLKVSDRLEDVTLGPYKVGTADALLWRDLANKRIGIRMKPNYTLDVNGYIGQNNEQVISAKNRGSYDVNNIYDTNIVSIASGSNCPSGSQHGVLLNIAYRQTNGNAKPDFAGQLFIPNGDDSSKPDSMFYRTANRDSWRSWNEVAKKSDIPTVPTVNNATLTIQKNGSNVATFTANASSNATANITVPTKTSGLTNDSGFITSSSLPSYGSNSNGYWLRFPTIKIQICWSVPVAITIPANNYSNAHTFTFPQAFSSTTGLTVVPTLKSGSSAATMGYTSYASWEITATNFKFRVFSKDSSGRTPEAAYIAIGPYS